MKDEREALNTRRTDAAAAAAALRGFLGLSLSLSLFISFYA